MLPYILAAITISLLFAPSYLSPLSHVIVGVNFGALAWLAVRLVR